MKKLKKSGFMEGAIIATLAIFITKFIGIIYVIPFYGIVGDQGGALYGYAYNIYNLFLIISTAGIPLGISKLTSEYNALGKTVEKEYMFKSVRKLIIIFSIICFLTLFILAPQIAHLIIGDITGGNTLEDIAFVIRCVSFSLLVVPMLAVSRGYLQGHGYIAPASFSQVIEQIVRVIVIIGGSFAALKIFHLSLKSAIGIAVFGACAGGLCAYLYLTDKLLSVRKNAKVETDNLSKNEKSQITKKIILYAIPFIVTNIANSIYNSTDMILLIKGLNFLGFKAVDIETISSVFTTWGNKLNTIIASIATGIAVSLVPSIAKSNAKKDYDDVNDKLNKTLQIFFYVALPLAIFMSIFAKEIWTIFYGDSFYGPLIFKVSILTAAVDALYILICNALQGLNKIKLVFLTVILGLGINLILDIPLILLFDKLNIYPFYGALCATFIGYGVSLIIPLVTLKRKYHLNYQSTIKKLPKLFGVYLIMIFLSLLYRGIINNIEGRFILIPLLGVIGIILLIIYYLLEKKEIEEILGKKISRLFRKKGKNE